MESKKKEEDEADEHDTIISSRKNEKKKKRKGETRISETSPLIYEADRHGKRGKKEG